MKNPTNKELANALNKSMEILIKTIAKKTRYEKILEQPEFKLNDKKKEINLNEEMENLKKLRAKNSRKRRIKNEQKHGKQIRKHSAAKHAKEYI